MADEQSEPGVSDDVDDDLAAERAMLTNAIGGWRGVIDSALPSVVFVVVYLVNGNDLMPAVWAAVAVAVVIAAWRIIRKSSLQQVIGGFVGVAIAAFIATRTGRAEDFFLPGILINAAWALVFTISIAVRWPIVGIFMGAIVGDFSRWRHNPELRRAYTATTWVWVGAYVLRLVVQVPLYLAAAVGPLGFMKVVMGWPLTLLAGWWSYLIIRPHFRAAKKQAESPGTAPNEQTD